MWATWMVVNIWRHFNRRVLDLEPERCRDGDEYGIEDERHQRYRHRTSG